VTVPRYRHTHFMKNTYVVPRVSRSYVGYVHTFPMKNVQR
jgi:hypothetical protein